MRIRRLSDPQMEKMVYEITHMIIVHHHALKGKEMRGIPGAELP